MHRSRKDRSGCVFNSSSKSRKILLLLTCGLTVSVIFFSTNKHFEKFFEHHADALLNQATLDLASNETAENVLQPNHKHILQWTTFWGSYFLQGSQYFEQHCPSEKRCSIFSDRRLQLGAEAVIFFISQTRALPQHPPHQHWVFSSSENPLGKSVFRYRSNSRYKHLFNLTSTYMSGSDFPNPYVKCHKLSDTERAQLEPRQFWPDAVTRPGHVLWFMSSKCEDTERVEYYQQLKKHIQVDLYGACGTRDTCRGRPDQAECLLALKRKYKFYLSFENGRCAEYITEKVLTGLHSGMVPVVMGPSIEDYSRLLPPDSFLHVDNFTSPERLAQYLHLLHREPDRYKRYHAWRQGWSCSGMSFPGGPWLCQLCAFLWDPVRSTVRRQVDLEQQFSPKMCRRTKM